MLSTPEWCRWNTPPFRFCAKRGSWLNFRPFGSDLTSTYIWAFEAHSKLPQVNPAEERSAKTLFKSDLMPCQCHVKLAKQNRDKTEWGGTN